MSWEDEHQRRTYWLPLDLVDRLNGTARRWGVSASSIVVDALARHLPDPAADHERPDVDDLSGGAGSGG
jgi:hypothetical protein